MRFLGSSVERVRASVGLSLAIAAIATACTGCEAPAPARERRALTTAKLLVPEPTMTVKASSATRKTLGIAEWRLYRGRGGVHLTGYSEKGKAVKGLSTVFTREADGNVGSLLARINDGSHFVVGHSVTMHTTAATKAIAPDSQAFVRRAALDLSLWQRLAQSQGGAPLTKVAALQTACSVQLPSTVLQSIVCLDAQTGTAVPPGICRIDGLANRTCLGLQAPRGINGGFGNLDGLSGSVCSSGDPRCTSIERENMIDLECGGAVTCVGERGGWLPLFRGDFPGQGGLDFPDFVGGGPGTTGPFGTPDFFDPSFAPGGGPSGGFGDDFGLGTPTQRRNDGVPSTNPFGTGSDGPGGDRVRFEDFRRSDNIEDRRDETGPSTFAPQGPFETPPDLSGTDLAKQAGIDDIGGDFPSQSSSARDGGMSFDTMGGGGDDFASSLADGTSPL